MAIRLHPIRSGLAAGAIISAAASAARAQDYRLDRILTGLQQPTYVTQAPGDNNSLYFMERTKVVSGNATAAMGRVVKYDLVTKTQSTFVDFSSIGGSVPNDSGALCVTFHPDFATNGKFYTTFAASPTPVSNELREYKVVGGVPTFQRTILKYNNNGGSFHTIDWIGFKHNQVGAARSYLYITTGDGGPISSTGGYVAKSENLNEIYGKVLRVDVSDGADAYPADANKNFGIPSINTYAGAPAKLGEVIACGFRNPFRASFDRANNDMYIGDVGFNDQEEVDFIKHESINPLSAALGVQNFGWARREGIQENLDSLPGVGGDKEPYHIDPFIYRTPATGDNSVTGGYVYRGPVTSLQGKYIFADYVAGKVYALNFDRNTNPTTFNGTNYTNFQDITSAFEAAAGGLDLRRISSFGEDNAGNLYLASLGDNVGSPYNSIAEGEIYRLVAIPVWNVNASGDYFTAGNWASFVAGELSGVDREVRFLGAINASKTVTANSPVTLGTMRFNNANTYVLSGSGSLKMQTSTGNGTIDVQAGTQRITLPLTIASTTNLSVAPGATLQLAEPVTVNSGKSLSQSGGGTVTYQSSVTLASLAAVTFQSSQTLTNLSVGDFASAMMTQNGTRVLKTGGVSVSANGGRVDLKDNKMIAGGGAGSWNGTAYTGVIGLVQRGYNGGSWNGAGIVTSITSAIAPNVLTALVAMNAADAGYAGGTFGGVSVSPSDALVMFSWGGDANMDGALNGDDYFQIDSNIGSAGSVFGYKNGDFNYDGNIDGDDYFIIDSNIVIAQSAPPFPTGAAARSRLTPVPEPGSALVTAAALAGASIIRRRRR